MTGLIVLGILGIAIAFLIWIMRAGSRAGARAWGQRWGWLSGGALTLLLVTSPLTWDTIPTIIAYRSSCDNAHLVVFKEAEQWKRENQEASARVRPLLHGEQVVRDYGKDAVLYRLNSRFGYAVRRYEHGFVSIKAYEVLDTDSKTILATQNSISTGKGNLRLHDRIYSLDDFKVWLNFPDCAAEGRFVRNVIDEFRAIGDRK